MIRAQAGVLALAVGLAAAACSRAPTLDQKPEAGDVAVARLGGETVWASDVRRAAVAEGVVGEGEAFDAGSEPFRRVLEQVIDQRLLAREASARRLDRDAVVRRRLAAARDKVLGDALIESELDKAVTDQAIQGLYQEQAKQRRSGDEVHVRQILLPAQTDAEAVKRQLAAGDRFEALAMQRSTDQATRFSGGDLGWVSPDALPEAWGAALKDAAPGAVLGPLRTEAGWVVGKLEERRPQTPLSLEEARPQIVHFLTLEQLRVMLSRLREKTRVQMLIPRAEAGPEPASAPAQPGPAPAKPQDRP